MERMIRKRRGKRELLLLFFVSFIAGITFQVIKNHGESVKNTVLSNENCMEVVRMKWEYEKLFIRCLLKRVLPVVLLPFGMLFSKREWLLRVLCIWFSFSFGALMELFALQYGLLGIFLFLAGIFPHYLCYIPAYILLYLWGMKEAGGEKHRFLFYCFWLGVVIIGALLESYVNPFILQTFLKIFFLPFHNI